MTFNIHTLTHMGDGHAQNEDALGTRVHPNAPTCCLCVLADSQGGRPGGQQAAQVAIILTALQVMHHILHPRKSDLCSQLDGPQAMDPCPLTTPKAELYVTRTSAQHDLT
ncbi:MAG: hypothetical protein AAFX99_26495 [Myxococcota bacterium]